VTETTPPFARLIGQTEKALNAILDRQLAGAVSEPQWVTLVLVAGSNGTADHDQLIGRVARALKTDEETAASHVGQLTAKGLICVAPEAGAAAALTGAGQQLLGRVQKQIGAITERLWGDLPDTDFEAARRVLSTVLERAESELRAAS
jgi:DNA-binding MarR family transcriptional regulator